MRTTNKIIIAVMLIAIMLLGVGYAAIQNITLNITGSATANPNDANFGVKFAETTEVSDSTKVTAAVTNDTNATINVTGLTSAGETVTATYTVQNTSTDLSADLTVETTNDNEEYFEITSQLGKTSLVAGEATILTVTVNLIKTPITDTETATIGIQLTATPVQPGEEGSSIVTGGSGGTTGGTTTSAGTYLPTGFSEVAGTSLATGLTIQDASGNQYVWVEVPQTTEVYATAGLAITDFTDEEYSTIEKDLRTYAGTSGNSYVDEHPEDTVEANTGLTISEYTELKQKMLKSVYQNGGFYIGKYETGIVNSYRDYDSMETEHPITETPVIQANAYPYNWVRCSQAQELASGMASGNYTSSLMFGVQWDLVMMHIVTKAVESGMDAETIYNILGANSTNYGNYLNSEYSITNADAKYSTVNTNTGECSEYLSAEGYSKASGECTILTTGASESFGAYGIYDLAGNMFEWTLEYTSSSSSPCDLRGGGCCYGGGDCPAASRGGDKATYSHLLFGFRPSIF